MNPSISILPAINTNFTHHISAGLANGTVITGQNNISHPSEPDTSIPDTSATTTALTGPTRLRTETEEHDKVEDANLPGTHPSLRRPAINFTKAAHADAHDDLPARIERVWYINPYGQEMRLPANPRVVDALRASTAVIYSVGSLFTSLVPALILKDVGHAIATAPGLRSKILLLNATNDRETGPSARPFTALDFVAAVAQACAESRGMSRPQVAGYWHYVTHVVYVEGGKGAPKVDREALAEAGVDAIKIYGRRNEAGESRFDAEALRGALAMIMGRSDRRGDKSRRNTLER